MNTQELLTDLQSLGVVLAANGGRLQVDAPNGVITPAIRAELARHKAELLALLGQAPTSTAPDNGGAEAPSGRPSSGAAAVARDPAETSGQGETRPEAEKTVSPSTPAAPWEGQRVRIEDLADFKARWGLRVVGGDPDLDGQPWAPKLYLVEV